MFSTLIGGLDMSVKGLPKWMAKMNPDHLSDKDKKTIIDHTDEKIKNAKAACDKNKALGARCIFWGDNKPAVREEGGEGEKRFWGNASSHVHSVHSWIDACFHEGSERHFVAVDVEAERGQHFVSSGQFEAIPRQLLCSYSLNVPEPAFCAAGTARKFLTKKAFPTL
eukprot:CAMPEP_0181315030 /NCGR_PEP_ID=MMETSP1101-20121128/15145_1 /TAXON_ID=46948 /ORGANISM="Rhodomonas abbreviata, Strain Caron Lab Isolate" /LENGTH=166 /DNA_ID=CAMNT_0023422185 /DNA_START=143 /DNA_END=639 /DNA_ORIENTATION=-